jgi:hypothetical protein
MTLASTSSSSITPSTRIALEGRPTTVLLPIIPILGPKIPVGDLLDPIVPGELGCRSMTRPPAFTEASLKRAINAARKAGLRVTELRQAAAARDWSEAR